jgi:hypothetical protein
MRATLRAFLREPVSSLNARIVEAILLLKYQSYDPGSTEIKQGALPLRHRGFNIYNEAVAASQSSDSNTGGNA